MRIIHTADWHIGQTLGGYGREFEHRAVLAQLVEIVAEREADALIVAGDVFDSQNPSGESQALFYDTLARLHRARPAMTIVVTAGNHDAAGRLEAPRPLLASLGAHVVGNVRRTGGRIDIAHHVVPLRDARGRVAAHVLAVSYPTAACLASLTRLEADGGSPIVRATAELYGELMEAARPLAAGAPLIVTGHLHVAGAIESEGAERRILVGGQHAVPAEIFPAEAAYVALGHLHKAQTIAAKGRGGGAAPIVRYAGSLLPLSASELDYAHGVTLVTIDGSNVALEPIPLPRPVPFLRLPRQGEMALGEFEAALAALGTDRDLPLERQPFVQVRLARGAAAAVAGYRAEADRIAAAFPVRLVDIRVAPPPALAQETREAGAVRLAELAPDDFFARAFQTAHGTAPAPAHLDVFHRALAEV